MKITIIGIDHQLQYPTWKTSTDQLTRTESEDKIQFRDLLRRLATNSGVGFIGEECLSSGSIGRDVAKYLNIGYFPVDLPHTDRERRGIICHYSEDSDPVEVRISNARREHFMVSVIEEKAAHDETGIVICGSGHIEGLAFLLRRNGHEVKTLDTLAMPLFDLGWLYRPRDKYVDPRFLSGYGPGDN